MRPSISCPVCSAENKHSKLVLYQINLTSAVYLCEDRNCAYPKGYEWIQVERTLNEINSTDDSDPKDLDNWLHSLFDSTEINTSCMTDDSINTDELLSKICDEFESMSDTSGNVYTNDFDESFFNMQLLEEDNGTEASKSPILDHLPTISNRELVDDKLDNNVTNEIPEKTANANMNALIQSDNKCTEGNNLSTISSREFVDDKLDNNVTNEIPEKTANANVNALIQSDNKCTDSNKDSISSPKILNFHNTNSCLNRNTEERKIKIIVNKEPGCNITKEQILEIIKKHPPANGKPIILNIMRKNCKSEKTN